MLPKATYTQLSLVSKVLDCIFDKHPAKKSISSLCIWCLWQTSYKKMCYVVQNQDNIKLGKGKRQ